MTGPMPAISSPAPFLEENDAGVALWSAIGMLRAKVLHRMRNRRRQPVLAGEGGEHELRLHQGLMAAERCIAPTDVSEDQGLDDCPDCLQGRMQCGAHCATGNQCL